MASIVYTNIDTNGIAMNYVILIAFNAIISFIRTP